MQKLSNGSIYNGWNWWWCAVKSTLDVRVSVTRWGGALHSIWWWMRVAGSSISFLYICLSICLSFHLSICPSIPLSICPSEDTYFHTVSQKVSQLSIRNLVRNFPRGSSGCLVVQVVWPRFLKTLRSFCFLSDNSSLWTSNMKRGLGFGQIAIDFRVAILNFRVTEYKMWKSVM